MPAELSPWASLYSHGLDGRAKAEHRAVRRVGTRALPGGVHAHRTPASHVRGWTMSPTPMLEPQP